MAAWLGLTPCQMTTGGKPRLLGISKRGNRYLRRSLIHGARAVLAYLVERETPLGRWARGLLARAHGAGQQTRPHRPANSVKLC
jgi:transposase